jgi:hypothetical protein
VKYSGEWEAQLFVYGNDPHSICHDLATELALWTSLSDCTGTVKNWPGRDNWVMYNCHRYYPAVQNGALGKW